MDDIGAKKFLLSSLAGLISLCLLYVALFYASLNTYTPSEWWIKDSYLYKEYLAEEIKGPKIIIAGGSSVLYGINSKVIEKITGYPVVNFGTHALLPLDFHYLKIKAHIKTGDIVVLPLEFRRYIDVKNSAWFYNNMMSWGKEDYIDQLEFIKKLQFITQVPKNRILHGLFHINKPLPLKTTAQMQQIVSQNIKRVMKANDASNLIYYLNQYGDINVNATPSNNVLNRYKKGARLMSTKSQEPFFESFAKIKKLVDSHKGTLILAWPFTMRNKKLDFSLPLHQSWANKLKLFLGKRDVDIYCNPVLHNLNLRFLFNFILHPNARGAILNSTNYANCINQVLAGTAPAEIDFETAVQQLKMQEEQFSRGLPPLPAGYQD